MPATLNKDRATDLLSREELQNTQTGLAQLARLSELRSSSERAGRAVIEGVSILRAAACIIQGVESENGGRLPVLHCRAGVDPDNVRSIATALTARVASARSTLTFENLDELFENEGWLQQCDVHSYLGVPVFNSNGSIGAVAAVLGEKNRVFGEADHNWLTVAGQLFGDSFSCEALADELHNLKQAAPQSPTNGALAKNASPSNLRQSTIMVIDDDRQVNDLLCQCLEMNGYRAEPAFNGVEALQVFDSAKHDLVITDVAMPLMNGWELIAALRLRAPSLPIVLISGYGIGEFNQSYLSKQGVSAVLKKPLELDKLAAVVNRLAPISS
jgi:CheY-like chemotaxis protein